MNKQGLNAYFFLFLFLALVAWSAFASFPTHSADAIVTLSQKLLQTKEFFSKNILPLPPQEPAVFPRPEFIRGVYCSGWIAGSPRWFPEVIDFINETEINSLVIDIKDETGAISYPSKITLPNSTKHPEIKITDIQEVLDTLETNQIFPIARIVVFKDPLLAKGKPEWAVKTPKGSLWTDNKGFPWIDPYNRQYWDYIVEISKEAIELGFREIQYDYVRFPSDGSIKDCVYPSRNGNSPADAIQEFLQYAKDQLQDYQTPISADVFGLTTTLKDDLGIGQHFEKIASSVDVICPMVYPSHYMPGNFGLSNPALHPYETVYRGVNDGRKRLEESELTTIMRPWLQDFNLGNTYGRAEIQAQIQAVLDAGIQEWIFWNPRCRYQSSKYN